jgi:pimeloyl-ACP methyl ester carboxylesterase
MPDLRGFGATDKPQYVGDYATDNLLADIDALADALGLQQFALVGHDWGGAIAWQAALHGIPLDGMVILNAPHPAAFRRALKTWSQRRRSWYMAFFQLPWLPELLLTRRGGRGLIESLARQSPSFPPDLLETLRRNILAPGAATAMLNYYRANMSRLAEPEIPFPRIEIPTLLIWGEDDIYLQPSLASGIERYAPNLTVHRLPGVSHWVQQDVPDKVNALIADWARAQNLAAPA